MDQIRGRTLPADVVHNVEVEQIVNKTILADVEQVVADLTAS